MALIKCRECGNDVSDAAIICPSCGLLFKTPEATQPEKKKRKPRATSTPKPKSQAVSGNKAVFQTLGLCIVALLFIGFLAVSDLFTSKTIADPVSPVIVRKYRNNERSSSLDMRTTIFAVVKNNGGAGKARVRFAVYQGKKSYSKDTIVSFGQRETTELNMTFSEVRLIDGDISFDATVKPL